MTLVKAFFFSLIAFIGLNAVFMLLAYLISGTFDVLIAMFEMDLLSALVMLLFGPVAMTLPPGLLLVSLGGYIIMGGPIPTSVIILYIGFLVGPAIAAFLAGYFGESRKEAFLGWFLTAMICAVIALVLTIVIMLTSAMPPPSTYIGGTIVVYLGVGLAIGLFYGCIALLTTREF
jgi:hypothetical protein